MRRRIRRRTWHLLAALAVSFSSLVVADLVSVSAPAPASDAPAHHLGRGFRNIDPRYVYPMPMRVRTLLRPGAGEHGRRLQAIANDGVALRVANVTRTITWVGHSTFLVQIDGVNLLTDPQWNDRTSPVRFAGPRRLVPPGVRFEDLPHIDVVIISHDHYDHLDAGTVLRLAREHHPRFFVPLGIKAWLAALNITDVVELDWWAAARFGPLTLTCAPAQHSSGRSLTLADQNLRLWASWAITAPDARFYFAGDTGYWRGLAEIGRRLGPFDVAALPIGGYSDYHVHHPNHLNPEEAVLAFEDLHARLMVPMHWGTFDLNREPSDEPPTRLMQAALEHGDEAAVAIMSPGQTIRW